MKRRTSHHYPTAKPCGQARSSGCDSNGEWFLELYNLEGEFRTERAMQYQVDVLCSEGAKPIILMS
ncbi:hypothetical protein O9992_21350 [Vibrio lentus]|nr:hypothetical protein [Vibrio lentus]